MQIAVAHLIQYLLIFLWQELAPTEKIPDDFYELGQDPEVLQHACPKHLENLKDEEVIYYSFVDF